MHHLHQIEIAQLSIADPNKNKNGDFYHYQNLENENLLVLLLADGVGSNTCDWKASRTSVEIFMEIFEQNSILDLPERMSKAIKEANRSILATTGLCQGMKSTFCAVVWDLDKEWVYYTNIGDSRIYELVKDKLQQISHDEVKSIFLKTQDGKPLIIAGAVAVAQGVTNVMGSDQLTFEIKSKSSAEIEAIVLSTDGFHDLSMTFSEDMIHVLNVLDLEKGIEQLYQKYKDRQKDDMTLIAARSKKESNVSTSLIESILAGKNITDKKMYEISRALLEGLHLYIREKNSEYVQQLLTYAEKLQIDLGRENIVELIELMAEINFENGLIYRQLLLFMRKSKG